MFLQETSWYYIEDADEFMDIFPEVEELPDSFPIAVQPIDTKEGMVLSIMTAEIGSYLWYSDSSVEFTLDAENSVKDGD